MTTPEPSLSLLALFCRCIVGFLFALSAMTKFRDIHQFEQTISDLAFLPAWLNYIILGLNSSAIGTLVERTTRFTLLLHLPPMDGHGIAPRAKDGPALAGHGAEAVRDAIAATISFPSSSANLLPGIKVPKWRSTHSCALIQTSKSTSVTRAAPGSAARMRTPTAYCASTSPKVQTSASIAVTTLKPSLKRLIPDLEKRLLG